MWISIICGFVGALFFYSAWSKLLDLRGFADVIAEYPFSRQVPPRMTVRLVIACEAGIGVALLSASRIGIWCGLAMAAVFTALALTAVAWRRWRGERRLRCGCFGDMHADSSAHWVLWRALALLFLVGLPLAFFPNPWEPKLELVAGYLVGCGLLMAIGLAWAVIQAWRHANLWKAPG